MARTCLGALWAAACVVGLLATACDGEGFCFLVKETLPDSGDQTPVPGGGTEPTPTPTPPPSPPTPGVTERFEGAWLASYGDDIPSGDGQYQYAVRLSLDQSGTALSGVGTMFRVVRTGAVAASEIPVTVSGTADSTGLDAQISMNSPRTGRVTWYLRATTTGLVGIYEVVDATGVLQRAGRAQWHNIGSTNITGSWVAAFGDDFGDAARGFPRRDRTMAIVLSPSADTLSGFGLMDEQIPGNPNAVSQDFLVTHGFIQGTKLQFSFGAGRLTGPMDWYGFFDQSHIAAAYAQFALSEANVEELARFGHTLWYRSPEAGPAGVSATWVTAFSDSATVSGAPGPDYLAVVGLAAQESGLVTGTRALVLNESDPNPVFEAYNVANGNILGSRVVVDFIGGRNRFAWDLRLAQDLMVGSYHRSDSSGAFAGMGNAEWRRLTSPQLAGRTWVAAYVDTVGELAPPVTQLALVSITSQAESGLLNGTGALRYAGEVRRRLLRVSGSILAGEITWTWQSPDAFGETVWHLRQAGDYLYGTYTNFTANGAVEFRGHAVFVPSEQTRIFSP